MKLSEAIEKLKWLSEQISPSPIKEAIDTVVSEVEKPAYTAEETQDFAEWCSKNKWYAFGQEEHMWYNYTKQITKTTTQLRELWEQQRKEATE